VGKTYVFWDDALIACMDYVDLQWLMELPGEPLEEMNLHIADNALQPVLRQQEV